MERVTIGNITDVLEQTAPLSFQESYDNAGLLCGSKDWECRGVFVCLDVSEEVIEQAVNKDCNLIVSHHPLIFRGLKNLLPTTNVNRCVLKALSSEIALYSSHTNLDAAQRGVNTLLAELIGLENFRPFFPSQNNENYFGIGGIGELKSQMSAKDLLLLVKKTLNIENIRYVEGRGEQIKTVALCSGSGSEFIPTAIAQKADCYLTSDIKYHDFLDAEHQILLADIGHFESEAPIKRRIVSIISENFCNFVPLFWDEVPNRVKNI